MQKTTRFNVTYLIIAIIGLFVIHDPVGRVPVGDAAHLQRFPEAGKRGQGQGDRDHVGRKTKGPKC